MTANINSLTIHEYVHEEGDAPILMLHGWAASIELILPLAEPLTRRGYRVYVPDLPGFGNSDPPPQAWTVHDYTRFVLAYADYHGLNRFHLFGHSFGGRLGLVLGAEYSDRIVKMVLADSAGVRPRTPITRQIRLSAYKSLRRGLNAAGLDKLSDSLRGWYNNRYGSSDFQITSGVMRETFIKVVNEDLQAYAGRVSVSTLLLWGDQDEDTPLWQGQRLEQLIPDAGLIVYKGAGHYCYLDRLHDAVQVIDHFFHT